MPRSHERGICILRSRLLRTSAVCTACGRMSFSLAPLYTADVLATGRTHLHRHFRLTLNDAPVRQCSWRLGCFREERLAFVTASPLKDREKHESEAKGKDNLFFLFYPLSCYQLHIPKSHLHLFL